MSNYQLRNKKHFLNYSFSITHYSLLKTLTKYNEFVNFKSLLWYNYIKGAIGLDGRYEVEAACRGSVTTLKGRKNIIANTNLALAA